jgi:ectoine hydroxylase-related dioxygenase (phytanoyl-CoA dioxygenase family)
MPPDLPEALSLLDTDGFVVVPGPFHPEEWTGVLEDYDRHAHHPGSRTGSSSIRTAGLKHAGTVFDRLPGFPPILEAARSVIGAPFQLSAFHGRTLLPNVPAPPLHQDCPAGDQGWSMLGFILMIDPFRPDNGATRFLAGSQALRALESPPAPGDPRLRQACGEAGLLILYNGSIWHEHGANLTSQPRRSVQGAMVRA